MCIRDRHSKSGEDIFGDGVLEILQDGFGFLRSADTVSYTHLDVYKRQMVGAIASARGVGIIRCPTRTNSGSAK